MRVGGLIASRLRFKGRMAVLTIAISFLVIILAVSISDGFRETIREGIGRMAGEVVLSGPEGTVSTDLSYLDDILELEGVESLRPVIYCPGIVIKGGELGGAVFKAYADSGPGSLKAIVPSGLATKLGLTEGDSFLGYFYSGKVRARRFGVEDLYDSPVQTASRELVFAEAEDLRRLMGYGPTTATAFELRLSQRYRNAEGMRRMAAEIATVCAQNAREDEDVLLAAAASDTYGRIFDWLDLIDFNVLAILVLMTLVAGFNMISGLLILLFRSTSTIGLLKALGMCERAIASVFLRVGARIALKGLLIGNGIALGLGLVQKWTHLVRLNPANYFVSYVPISIDAGKILLTDVSAFLIIMILLLLPCLFISKVEPSETLRIR